MTQVGSTGHSERGHPDEHSNPNPLEGKDWNDPGDDDNTRGIAPMLDRDPRGRPEHA